MKRGNVEKSEGKSWRNQANHQMNHRMNPTNQMNHRMNPTNQLNHRMNHQTHPSNRLNPTNLSTQILPIHPFNPTTFLTPTPFLHPLLLLLLPFPFFRIFVSATRLWKSLRSSLPPPLIISKSSLFSPFSLSDFLRRLCLRGTLFPPLLLRFPRGNGHFDPFHLLQTLFLFFFFFPTIRADQQRSLIQTRCETAFASVPTIRLGRRGLRSHSLHSGI